LGKYGRDYRRNDAINPPEKILVNLAKKIIQIIRYKKRRLNYETEIYCL
jgi:hypothetical protein